MFSFFHRRRVLEEGNCIFCFFSFKKNLEFTLVFIERMKFTALFTLSALLSVAAVQTVQGQVSVSVVLDQDIYLSGEAVIATVEITNLSGQTIQLGESPNWLEFSIESK